VRAHTGAFKAEFGIPEDYDPIGGVTVGYRAPDIPAQSPKTGARRRAPADVVHRGQWDRHG
jgi:nitroreductase